jgi:DNA repair exonuclease SbcCD nuclease subunit
MSEKLKYHKEYRAVFEQLYDKLREEKPDIIVNTGDTFHTKVGYVTRSH